MLSLSVVVEWIFGSGLAIGVVKLAYEVVKLVGSRKAVVREPTTQPDFESIDEDPSMAVHAVYMEISALLVATPSSRVALIRVFDLEGGGVALDMAYEVISRKTFSIRRDWRGRTAEPSHRELLSRLWSDGRVSLLAAELPEGHLRDSLTASGIARRELFALKRSTTAGSYLVVDFSDASEVSPDARYRITSTVERLKRVVAG